jgi:hypothetical protein
MRSLCCLFAGVLLSGCASTLSTLQTARPVERGHVQATVGMGYYVPLGQVFGLLKTAVPIAERGAEAARKGEPFAFSEEEAQTLLTTGVALAVMPPSSGFEVSLRTGVVENLDVGLRYSANALRIDGKYRIAQQVDKEKRWDIAAGVGVSKYLFKHPIFDVLEFVKVDEFSRWDVEVPVYFSAELGEVLMLYGAPKYVYSRTNLDQQLVRVSESGTIGGQEFDLPLLVHTHFAGATAGLALGFRHVHLMLELTGGYTVCSPRLFGDVRRLGGVTLYPAGGLSFRF